MAASAAPAEVKDAKNLFKVGVARAVSVGEDGLVYVAERYCVKIFSANGIEAGRWGGRGRAEGEFGAITSLLAFQGKVYVTQEEFKHCVQVLSGSGKLERKIGSHGNLPGQFEHPVGVAVLPVEATKDSVEIFVIDEYRCQVWNEAGELLRHWGKNESKLGSVGIADGSFSFPLAITSTADGHLVIADNTGRIQFFDRMGRFVRKFCSKGSGDGQVEYAHSLAALSENRIAVADYGNNRIQVFDKEGKAKLLPATQPESIAACPDGRVCVIASSFADYSAQDGALSAFVVKL